MYYDSTTELLGNTPLVELKNIEAKLGLKARVFAKLEMYNPTGSAKDRIAYQMILDAEEAGELEPGSCIIEPTSGNTGIGLAAFGVSRGYDVIIVMPDSMSIERIKFIKSYGAEVVLTPGAEGMKGAGDKAVEIRDQMISEGRKAIVAGQFDNPSNPKAHYLTTGPEIYRDLDGRADIFVAGIGTGGTITGTGRYLKERAASENRTFPLIIGVEPDTSPLLTKGTAGPHKLQGIGANFVPAVLDREVIDEIVTETYEDSIEFMKLLGSAEGIFAGITSGAACHAAAEFAKLPENEGKNIVVLLPDSGDRYLSSVEF